MRRLTSFTSSHPFEVRLRGLQKSLTGGDPHTSHVDIQTETLLLQPVTHLILGPACKWSIDVTRKTIKSYQNLILGLILKHGGRLTYWLSESHETIPV